MSGSRSTTAHARRSHRVRSRRDRFAHRNLADPEIRLHAGLACERLALTAKAWAQGEISASAARTIGRGLRDGYADIYLEMEPTLVEYATARAFRDLDTLIGQYGKYCDALDDREPSDRNGLHLSQVNGPVGAVGRLRQAWW